MSIIHDDNKKVLDAINELDEKFTKRFDRIESGIKGLAKGQIQIGQILDRVTNQEFEDQIKAHREGLEEIVEI